MTTEKAKGIDPLHGAPEEGPEHHHQAVNSPALHGPGGNASPIAQTDRITRQSLDFPLDHPICSDFFGEGGSERFLRSFPAPAAFPRKERAGVRLSSWESGSGRIAERATA
jgi:hypothetical protein